jgi:hypothetical protein
LAVLRLIAKRAQRTDADCRSRLQRFAQLVEQAGILDGDHGLAGEAGEQRDLLVREGTNFLTKDGNDSNELIVFRRAVS